jgi:prolipoprotein diacylglyceryltransferase
MARVLVEWRGIRIWSYPAMLYVGLVTGVFLQFLVARQSGLPALRVYLATLALLPLALAGSRFLFVVTHWPEFREARHRIWRWGEGGLAMYGGVPVMLIASIALLPLFGVPFWPFWDSAVFCIFPGMAFARIGCVLNGCCAGRPTRSRFGMWLADGTGRRERRLPVQLLEFAAAVLLLVACWSIRNALPRPGMLFMAAAAGYGAMRLVLQPLRREREFARRLDVQAAISIVLIVIGISALALL